MKKNKDKTKMYLAITLIMVIVFIAWILNLKNSWNSIKQKPNNNNQWQEIENNLNKVIIDIKSMGQEFTQPATTTATDLQGGPPISPDQLGKIIEKLNLDVVTTTPTSTLP